MTEEKAVLLSLLRLTQGKQVRKELIAKDARIPAQTTDQVLRRLSQEDFFTEHNGFIEASPSQRVKIAVYALTRKADFEQACKLLSWREFENIVSEALEANGYQTLRNFHFKQASKRWEIDILGLKKPFILCVDCKHWKRGWQKAATAKAVEAQTLRTQALAKALPSYSQDIHLTEWKTARLIPIVLSLTTGPYKFLNDVPVVPVLQFQDFISELPAHIHYLTNFHQDKLMINEKLQDFC